MTTSENLSYASLIRRTSVRNTQTGETGTITAAANMLVEITLSSGPDAGTEITMSPAEAITFWRKVE